MRLPDHRIEQIMPAPPGLVCCEHNSYTGVVEVSPCLGLALLLDCDDPEMEMQAISMIRYHHEGFLVVDDSIQGFYPHDDRSKREVLTYFALPLSEVESYFSPGREFEASEFVYWGVREPSNE